MSITDLVHNSCFSQLLPDIGETGYLQRSVQGADPAVWGGPARKNPDYAGLKRLRFAMHK